MKLTVCSMRIGESLCSEAVARGGRPGAVAPLSAVC